MLSIVESMVYEFMTGTFNIQTSRIPSPFVWTAKDYRKSHNKKHSISIDSTEWKNWSSPQILMSIILSNGWTGIPNTWRLFLSIILCFYFRGFWFWCGKPTLRSVPSLSHCFCYEIPFFIFTSSGVYVFLSELSWDQLRYEFLTHFSSLFIAQVWLRSVKLIKIKFF